ncbi:MAG: primosomal protein N' [Casimicrobiaceae bacterium]
MNLLRVALPIPLHRSFDYSCAEATGDDRGRLVRVKLGPRRMVGVVIANPEKSEVDPESLIAIEGFADDLPRLPEDILALATFAADYYQFPLGMALQHAVPPRGRRPEQAVARAPTAYRVTDVGLQAVEALPGRAHRQRAVAHRFADRSVIQRAELLAAEPTAAPLLRKWLADGWIVPAEAVGRADGPGAVCLPPLSKAQQSAVDAIDAAAGRFEPFLLHGVTGSGKTEVYLADAAATIGRGGQVLMLVPEINLTPQLAGRIQTALPAARIVLLHSHLSDAQRLDAWRLAASGRAQFILGTRLAVFAPLPRLGLIVVDEEHDVSYKQQDGLRYHARDLAVYRARMNAIPVVLGSATPSLETLRQVRRRRYRLLSLNQRAGGGTTPVVRLIAQRTERSAGPLSTPIIDGIRQRLERGEQSLLFINRRGFSPSLLCVECAWAAQCERCSARLVVHLAEKCLRCHHCGHQEALTGTCPVCGNQDLLPLGFGTQRLESALRDQFPAARIARVDADSTRRKGAWQELLLAILGGELDILIGTQMMVKGHDFPRLTLVGILGADNALYSADFRATERLYAQLTQVAGRAGRAELAGEVLIQTDFPAHPLYRAMITHDQAAHIESLFAEREQLGLPPFSRLALLRAEARARPVTDAFLATAHGIAVELATEFSGVRVNAPVPARMARRAGFERGHVLVQSGSAPKLHSFLSGWRAWLTDNAPRDVRWSIDVDPQDVD